MCEKPTITVDYRRFRAIARKNFALVADGTVKYDPLMLALQEWLHFCSTPVGLWIGLLKEEPK